MCEEYLLYTEFLGNVFHTAYIVIFRMVFSKENADGSGNEGTVVYVYFHQIPIAALNRVQINLSVTVVVLLSRFCGKSDSHVWFN
jgi:hypothetical protein